MTFTEHAIQVNEERIRYLEAGQGSAVVILHAAEEPLPSSFHALLAQQFRVIVFDLPRSAHASPRELARTLTQAIAGLPLDHYVLMSASAYASSALWQAIAGPEHVDGLVLIAPPALRTERQTSVNDSPYETDLVSRLAELKTPTLVLLGTNDKSLPRETGQQYVERLPDCYYVLVYDAGPAMESERPEALCEAVCDFIERRGAFIVERKNTAVHP